MVLLSMVVLLGFAGFATDVGTLFQQKRLCQTVADSAAIAGASQLKFSAVAASAQADAARNGMTNGVNGAAVTVNNPPASGPHANDANYVEVIATQNAPTFFMKVFNFTSVPVSARAVATLVSGSSCLTALAPSGTGLSTAGPITVSATQCGIFVNSNASNALAINNSGSLTANTIGVVGAISNSGGAVLTPAAVTGVAALSDPLSYLTVPACATPGTYDSAGGTVTAGSFPSGLSITSSGATTFGGGIYCFGGPLSIAGTGTVTGSNVTFYFSSSASASFGATAIVNLSAPTSGAYNGILIYQDSADTATESLGGNAGGTLAGVIYAPQGTVTLGGTVSGTFAVAVVAGQISLSGTAALQNYATVNGTMQMASALVE
jgi:hypothetical protein